MLFSTVEIRPSIAKSGEWSATFTDLEGDRNREDQGPHPLGFYHYPRSMGREKAFWILKNYMVKQYEDEIAELTNRLEKLRSLNPFDAE